MVKNLSKKINLKKADMRIKQMSFMILFVFILFAVAGLFIIGFQRGNIRASYQIAERNTAIASLATIAQMPELNCESSAELCLDEDKLYVFAAFSNDYKDFWPIASINVTKIIPGLKNQKRCPAANCTYYEVYKSAQKSVQQYSTFVSICKKVNPSGIVYKECSLGKIDVGVIIHEENN